MAGLAAPVFVSLLPPFFGLVSELGRGPGASRSIDAFPPQVCRCVPLARSCRPFLARIFFFPLGRQAMLSSPRAHGELSGVLCLVVPLGQLGGAIVFKGHFLPQGPSYLSPEDDFPFGLDGALRQGNIGLQFNIAPFFPLLPGCLLSWPYRLLPGAWGVG